MIEASHMKEQRVERDIHSAHTRVSGINAKLRELETFTALIAKRHFDRLSRKGRYDFRTIEYPHGAIIAVVLAIKELPQDIRDRAEVTYNWYERVNNLAIPVHFAPRKDGILSKQLFTHLKTPPLAYNTDCARRLLF